LSGLAAIPGTIELGAKPACSICAKKLSGFLFSGHRADLDQQVVAVRPHLGQVERVEP
jgi:hypothetical protein